MKCANAGVSCIKLCSLLFCDTSNVRVRISWSRPEEILEKLNVVGNMDSVNDQT
jgi:hypothetical protein